MTKFGGALIFLLMFPSLFTQSQNMVNNGSGIVISPGAFLVIGGQYVNLAATQDGFVDNDGNMVVYDDFVNDASNSVFINVEPVPDGITILPGVNLQAIDGTSSTRFENLRISGGEKILANDHAFVAGSFDMAAVFNLNTHILELEKESPATLHYQSGYLLAETPPALGLGTLRWNINDQAGSYEIPFGSGSSSGNDLNVNMKITQAASGSGAVNFSTYPTSSDNVPLPDIVPSLDPYDPGVTVNRFWIIDAQQSVKPGSVLTFSYTFSDVNPIQENTLGAIRFNEDMIAWDDIAPMGSADVISNTFTTEPVLPSDLYKNWTLSGSIAEDFIYIPNSFTPNGDGLNDWFYPVIGNELLLKEYYFSIFDRWGKELFSSVKQGTGWDGMYKNVECQQDVYVYVFEYINVHGNKQRLTGKVTIVR